MIGIFDSGSGGLTVLRALRDVLPSCDVVYFGDIAHAPYGSKSQEELADYVAQGLSLLRARGAERLISACNTASASLALSLYDAFDMEPGSIIEMVGPTVSYFKGTKQRIALCATPATIQSGIYQNAFRMLGQEVTAVAIPGLAGAIEFAEGKGGVFDNTYARSTGARQRQKQLISDAFKNISWSDFDVLILACTHYPLALDIFKEVVPENIEVFDPAIAVAERAAKLFWPQEVRDGKTQFVISQDSQPFRALVKKMFPDAADNIEVAG
jgi:glutamate racemase